MTDAYSLPAATFARLAVHLPAYGGAVAAAWARRQPQEAAGEPEPDLAGMRNIQFERAAGESFESRMARAQQIPHGGGENAEKAITAAMMGR